MPVILRALEEWGVLPGNDTASPDSANEQTIDKAVSQRGRKITMWLPLERYTARAGDIKHRISPIQAA